MGGESLRPIVVSGDHEHWDPELDDGRGHGAVEQFDCARGRERPVEHVARDDHRVRAMFAQGRQVAMVDEVRLVFQQVDASERSAQMPVSGVEESHGCC